MTIPTLVVGRPARPPIGNMTVLPATAPPVVTEQLRRPSTLEPDVPTRFRRRPGHSTKRPSREQLGGSVLLTRVVTPSLVPRRCRNHVPHDSAPRLTGSP